MTPIILFPAEDFNPKAVDPHFAPEKIAAAKAGFQTAIVDMERYDQDMDEALRYCPNYGDMHPGEPPCVALYRGWMLKPKQYGKLFRGLMARKIDLVTNPEQYETAHYLPEWYPQISGATFASVHIALGPKEEPSPSELKEKLKRFGADPLVLKDYVKSQKHYWDEACYIPNAADTAHVLKVVRRFIELQGEIAGGLVFRQYEPLKKVEERFFCFNGEFIFRCSQEGPPIPNTFVDEVRATVRYIQSPFYTVDVALREHGAWVIIEIGDGMVSGIPQQNQTQAFYDALAAAMGLNAALA